MAVTLPSLAPINFTALDFNSIVTLTTNIIQDNPSFFSGTNDFLASNAAIEVIQLVAYIVDLLSDRIDWIANELTLPTATQLDNVMNLLALINYRLSLPRAAATTVTLNISQWVPPFVIPALYKLPATDLNGNTTFFELLNKDNQGNYIYSGSGSAYQFDTSFQVTPILSHNDLVFYEGTSFQEFYTMQGAQNETVQLGQVSIEESSVEVWKVTLDPQGNILTQVRLTQVTSFISPQAQQSSAINLPPYEIQDTDQNGVILVFGQTPVVAIFNTSGTDQIMVWYRSTIGANGNITANSINYTTTLLTGGVNIQANFLNTVAASGGTNSETIDHARAFGPLTITTVEKTVNPDDFVILLQDLPILLNAIAYGKSNEPINIFNELGYFIPPDDAWIYPVVNQTGWENLPTYAYSTGLRVTRPFTLYGLVATEQIIFNTSQQVLTKFKLYALSNNSTNIKVTDFFNQTIYVPGSDYVIDLNGRTISLAGGNLAIGNLVIVQYYENSGMGPSTVEINFATDDTQPIPVSPIYPGLPTYAKSLDLTQSLSENTLSSGDYNWPDNDYYVNYQNSTIIRNPSQPFLEGKVTFGIAANNFIPFNGLTTVFLANGINNQFILDLNGLNVTVYNSRLDITVDCYNGWATVGNGLNINYTGGNKYSFQIALDSGEFSEYGFTAPGSGPQVWTTAELGLVITSLAVDLVTAAPFSNSGAIVFADSFLDPNSPVLTFMSLTTGVASQVQLAGGSLTFPGYANLFSIFPSAVITTGNGEIVDIFEAMFRLRAAFNSLGLCSGYIGQMLPINHEESPEIYSNINISSPAAFTITAGVNDTLKFNLTGTAASDGLTTVTLTATAAGSPYDLTTYQGRMTLIVNLQTDLNAAYSPHLNVVKALWMREYGAFYRIGFRQVDTGNHSLVPSIEMYDNGLDPITTATRTSFKFSANQISTADNLLVANISPDSDMDTKVFTRISLTGAFGPTAFIQIIANTAINSNAIAYLGMANQQMKTGGKILQRTLIATRDVIPNSPGSNLYQINSVVPPINNMFNLTITGGPSGFNDGDYVVTIAPGLYNINQLVSAINVAFETSLFNGIPTNISGFLIAEKIEGYQRIRIIMTDFSSTVSPNVQINANGLPPGSGNGQQTVDTLGFLINQDMATASTIILHYGGNWVSNPAADTSQATAIVNSLVNNRIISLDLIVQDTKFTTFDIQAVVNVHKGYALSPIQSSAETAVHNTFAINKVEFQSNVAVSSVTNVIGQTPGVDYMEVQYFGRDYQLYINYKNNPHYASATGTQPAEDIIARWFSISSFQIKLDGCTVGNVNYDGQYLITVGNSWADRTYTSVPVSFTSTAISFSSIDNSINLALGNFPTGPTGFAAGQVINIAGSIFNNFSNGVIQTVSTVKIVLSDVVLVDESAGRSVTLSATILSLLGAVHNGLKNAINLALGGTTVDITPAVNVKQNSGVFTIYTTNSGPNVMLGLSSPANLRTLGYQTFVRTTDILDSVYTPSVAVSFTNSNLTFIGASNSVNTLSYTRTDLSFVALDNSINTSAGNFITAGFAPDQIIYVIGSALNNFQAGVISTVSATKIVMTNSVTIIDESDANSITISVGDFLAKGFINGQTVHITGSTSNNVTGVVASVSVIQIILSECTIVNESDANSITISVTKPIPNYSIKVSINGSPTANYSIASPTAGTWKLADVAAALNTALPNTTVTGIDANGLIRITSLFGGFASTIGISAGTAPGTTNLIPLLEGVNPAVPGTQGYINCLEPTPGISDGVLYIQPTVNFGLTPEPTPDLEFYNFQNSGNSTIPSDYNEILVVSNDYFLNGTISLLQQVHGLILDYVAES